MAQQTKAQKQAASDERQLKAYEAAVANLAQAAKAVEGIGTHEEWKVSKLVEAMQVEVAEGAERMRTRIAQRAADAEAAANSDRAKVKRAFAALRKQGFTTSVNEPGYESTKDHSFPIAEAQQNQQPYAFVARQRWNYAFAEYTPWMARSTGTGDTLTHDLNINWGPDANAAGEFDGMVATRILDALLAQGLDAEWTSNYNCVTVKAREAK